MLARAWGLGLAIALIASISLMIGIVQAAKLTFVIYFLIYLPGFLLARKESALEQNTLSIVIGIMLITGTSYAMLLLRLPYTKTTLILAALILGAVLWELKRRRKIPGGKGKKKARQKKSTEL